MPRLKPERPKSRWRPVSKDFIRHQKEQQRMTDWEQKQRERQAREDARSEQADLILTTVAGLAKGTHCLRIEQGDVTRVWVEPR